MGQSEFIIGGATQVSCEMRTRICYVLSLLGIHRPDCEHCMARLTCGNEMRKRLEELNGRTQTFSREKRDAKAAVSSGRVA